MQPFRRQPANSSLIVAVLLTSGVLSSASVAAAANCPFCDAVRPTWSQLREPAEVVALAQVTSVSEEQSSLRLTGIARGENVPQHLELALSAKLSPGEHVLLLGERGTPTAGELQWNDIPMSPQAYEYLRNAPDLRNTPAERLPYFIGFLEDDDPLIAEDAYMEFAHAPYGEVKAVSDSFDGEQLRAWLINPGVPDLRKGFYALALSLSGGDDAQRADNIAFLQDWVENPGDDFRRGLDGVMGALLLARQGEALEFIRQKFLANPDAANGHVRNALAAVRFYYEFGEDPDIDAIAQAVACLLDRPAFATEAIIDLARWESWETLPRVVALFGEDGYDATTKHAIVAYLLTCDDDMAGDELERLRELDPDFVNAAEDRFLLFGSIR